MGVSMQSNAQESTARVRLHSSHILDVIDQLNAAESAQVILRLLSEFAAPFGFSNAAAAQIINPCAANDIAASWQRVHNMPEDWFETWMQDNAMIHDPVITGDLTSTQPFFWRDAYRCASAAGFEVLEHAREIDLNDGFAIPIRSLDGPPGLVTFGGERIDLAMEEAQALHLVASHAFACLSRKWSQALKAETPKPHFTARETEVMHWVAAGKTNWEIGTILNISVNTVDKHIAAAKTKLGATTKVAAVVAALSRGIIRP